MVGRQGFEPWTNGLKGRCSTAELPTHLTMHSHSIVRSRAIEYQTWRKLQEVLFF